MKKFIQTAVLLAFTSSTFAQNCPANDSTTMGPGSGNDVYYSLNQFTQTGNGIVKVLPNNDWHMAISVQGSSFPGNPANGVAIRINSPLGENPQTGASGWSLVKLNGADPNNWRNIDTTGLYALPELLDSDSTWDLSAFTSGYTNTSPFNFIWGTYSQTNHNVVSNNVVYVLYNKSANQYKKIHVKELTYDTLWHIVLSNIDNTDSVYLNVNKRAYSKRMFVYYNVLTNQIIDREPNNDTWDLLWTKYKGLVDLNGVKIPYNVTGVLSNRGVTVAQNLGKKCNEVWLINKTANYIDNISAIGYDWKTFNNTTFTYSITDTFVYFIKKDTNVYKMTMKSYAGGSQGKTTFNFYQANLNVDQVFANGNIILYPNPTSDFIRLETDLQVQAIEIYDMNGRKLMEENDSTIQVSGLKSGIYLISVKTESGVYNKTFIKE